ncbi:MAG: hypothetical protein V3W32_05610, partial [Gemmatimonadota bacterium]
PGTGPGAQARRGRRRAGGASGTRALAVRGDVRMHHIFDAFAGTRELILVDPVWRDLFALELSIGVSYFIGR